MTEMYYLCCFIIAIIANIIYFFRWHKHYSVYFTLLYIFVPIANWGYWQLSIAKCLEEAILANKILYMGACYTPLVVMLNIFFLCKIRIGKLTHTILYMITTAIYLASLTVGYNGMFYHDVDWENVKGHMVMVKEYGSIHTVFYIMLAVYSLLPMGALIHVIYKKRDVSIKNTFIMLAAMITTLFSFIVGRAIGKVEMTPICYDIGIILFLVISDRLALYNVDDTVISALMRFGNLGVVSFDLKYNYLGSNDVAKRFYPQLEKLRIDRRMDEKDEDLKELREWLSAVVKDKILEFEYWNDNKFYKVTAQYLYIGRVIKGYHFIFRDCTEEKEREEYLKRIATIDEMTNVNNRRAFDEDLTRIKEQESKDKLVLMTCDLNSLKTANDTMGHIAGDELIKGAADCLVDSIGELGKVYRTGGDEYVCILHCDEDELKDVLDKIDKSSENWRGHYNDTMNFSKGVASTKEFPKYSISNLKKEADRRMYLDKEAYYKRTGLDRRK